MPETFMKHENQLEWERGTTDESGKTSWGASITEGVSGEPQVRLIKSDGGKIGPPHSHSEDEVVYVLEGSISIKGKLWGPGSSLFIKRGDVYQMIVGPDGVKFLLIRGTRAKTIHA